jgi:hypothetical protein
MPLAMTGMPVSFTNWSATSSAPSAHTSVPRMSTGRFDAASSSAIRPRSSESGSIDGVVLPADGAPSSPLLKNSSNGMSTNVGPRCDDPASVNASSTVGAMSATVWAVVADLVIVSKIGG